MVKMKILPGPRICTKSEGETFEENPCLVPATAMTESRDPQDFALGFIGDDESRHGEG